MILIIFGFKKNKNVLIFGHVLNQKREINIYMAQKHLALLTKKCVEPAKSEGFSQTTHFSKYYHLSIWAIRYLGLVWLTNEQMRLE